jgi:hypothetical protein
MAVAGSETFMRNPLPGECRISMEPKSAQCTSLKTINGRMPPAGQPERNGAGARGSLDNFDRDDDRAFAQAIGQVPPTNDSNNSGKVKTMKVTRFASVPQLQLRAQCHLCGGAGWPVRPP